MGSAKVLVIDDDRVIRHIVRSATESAGLEFLEAVGAADGLPILRQETPDLVLLDIMLPEVSGLDLFGEIRQIDPTVPVIFITAISDSDTAIRAMQLGANDYIVKPLRLEDVRSHIQQALDTRTRMEESIAFSKEAADLARDDLLIGRSPEMQEVYKAIGRVAAQDVTVLIRGESGTGKELVARAIHQHSPRAEKGFLAINCAAIPEALLESELFGHEKGSFTGAANRRVGKFEQCSGGTLFLDEIGDMSPVLQAKILRVLQEQRFERVGGTETIQTNVRVIAATHRDLETMVANNEFRADLYYRLNGFTITLPPLRDRKNDLRALLGHLLARFSQELGKQVQGIEPDALQQLLEYPWPGNVRELQSVVRQAILQATGPVLVAEFLPVSIRNGKSVPETDLQPETDSWCKYVDRRLSEGTRSLYEEMTERMERMLLARVLRATNGNQSHAAQILGITRGSLRHKIRLLGISIGQVVNVADKEDTLRSLS